VAIKAERNVDLGKEVLTLMARMGSLSKQKSEYRRDFRES